MTPNKVKMLLNAWWGMYAATATAMLIAWSLPKWVVAWDAVMVAAALYWIVRNTIEA